MIALRDACPEDCKTIAKLHADSWRKYYRGMYSDKFLDNDVYQNRLDVWHQRLSAPALNQQVIIASDGENISGFACIYVNDDPLFGTLLDNLHVTSSIQRSGIGTMLIKEAARRSYERKEHSKFYLWVFELNANARRFYENLGAVNYETVDKKNLDDFVSKACRYTWDSCLTLMHQ
ncbi:MAG TPA: GNAT family N-acetyltransferase [Parafilimonas sp.]|nr:GNAT family N-acetyltransferase [Parafilimonas sp.]